MTLWELAPFQVRSSVFEIESYLMWFQKGKGKLRHWIWVGEIVPLGWQEEPGWAGGTKQGTRVHTHTCTHTPWGYWLACINSPAMLEKKKKNNVLCRVQCVRVLLLQSDTDSGNRKHHEYVRRSYCTSWGSESMCCKISGLHLQRLSSLGNSLWSSTRRKQLLSVFIFFPLIIEVLLISQSDIQNPA